MIQARKLNRRLTLEHETEGTNAHGEPCTVWAAIATEPQVWASVRGLDGREAERAGLSLAQQPYELQLRYREDLTPEMRLLDGATPLYVVSAVDPDGRRRELRVVAVQRK